MRTYFFASSGSSVMDTFSLLILKIYSAGRARPFILTTLFFTCRRRGRVHRLQLPAQRPGYAVPNDLFVAKPSALLFLSQIFIRTIFNFSRWSLKNWLQHLYVHPRRNRWSQQDSANEKLDEHPGCKALALSIYGGYLHIYIHTL